MVATIEFSRQVGALPVRKAPDGTLNVLLVTTLQTQRWIIPKGWPWPGRQDWARRQTGLVPVRVTVYLLEVNEELETWPECQRRQRAWFTLADAAEAVTEPELRALLLQLKAASEPPAVAT
jgi:hypothetical protein